MIYLLSPDVAYVLLLAGFLTAVLACLTPGTAILELGALFTIVLAGYMMVNLPANGWALLVIALSIVPFLLHVRTASPRLKMAYLAVAYLMLVGGSAFLFDGVTRWPAIHPALVLFMPAAVLGTSTFLAHKSIQVLKTPAAMDPDQLIGATGKAVSDIRGQGAVYVQGENWTASSRVYIRCGDKVRVRRRNGLVLEVEPEAARN